MGISDFLARFGEFGEMYYNERIVLLAFFLLVFILIFSILIRTRLGENRGIAVVITVCISGIFVYSFRNLIYWIAGFNILLIIAVIAIIIILAIPFFRYLRRQ